MVVLILISTFVILFVLGVPIAFSLGISTLATMLVTMDFIPAVTTIAQRMAGGINSFALLAIPLFILSGLLMAQGGIARRVIDFSKAVIGSLPGGLAFVNVVSCMLFGAISGSAVAATSAIEKPCRGCSDSDMFELAPMGVTALHECDPGGFVFRQVSGRMIQNH